MVLVVCRSQVVHLLAGGLEREVPQVGRDDEAADVLAQVRRALEGYTPRNPGKFEWFALQSALESDLDAAYEYLAQAVEIGWANYHQVKNDPAWAAALQDERIAALLEIAKDRVTKQRELVEANEANENFRVRFDSMRH